MVSVPSRVVDSHTSENQTAMVLPFVPASMAAMPRNVFLLTIDALRVTKIFPVESANHP